jgi:hypothetical protein
MASFSTPLDFKVNINSLLFAEKDMHWEFDGDYNIYNTLWTFVKVTFKPPPFPKKICRMVKN